MTTTITPSLWFDDTLEDAIDLYSSIFPDTKTHAMMRGPDGTVFTAEFELAGQRFKGLNGGPMFPFTEAISITVECEDQDEVDRYWSALTADGGEGGQCGWLKDRFGLSWQVAPKGMAEMFADADPSRASRAMQAMFTMKKLDIAALERAADGAPV